MRSVLGLLVLAAALPFGACDAYEPTWRTVVDTASLYSISRADYIGRPGAYDFAVALSQGGGSVVVERPSAQFDFAVSEIDGQLVALPAGLFQGQDSAGIAIDSSGVSFENWRRAPGDGYEKAQPVALRTGVLYAVRSRRSPADGCTHYGKFEVLNLDADGTVELQAVRNRLCNDRDLIPPTED